ncbi:MAG: hypothetical protein ABJA78_02990 [Ferruginibacter sp.]
MEENTDEEPLDNSPIPLSESLSDQNNPITDAATINTNPEIENMEVHHHPDLHHKPKKWKEYFLEFLMIFLAVTLGFFAESYREHIVKKETEKQSIESLVKCLASDTIQLENVIKANIKVVGQLDSLVQLRNADLSIEVNKRNFLRHSIVGFSEDWYFNTNDAALQQLKSSGTLRLIRKQNIVDSIFKYELENKTLVGQQADLYFLFKESFLDYKKAVGLFFYRDTTVMKYSFGYDNSDVEFRNINPVLLNTDKEKINLLFGNAALMAGPQEAYIHLMQDQLSYGKNLIAFLKEEYHLE